MIKLSRRQFAASGIASLAFGGLARNALAQTGETYRNEVPGYGPLVRDRAGYLDLPEGFSYKIISRAGDRMDDGFIVPDNFDGMGCVPLGDSRLALIRNHELKPGAAAKGPAGGDAALAARLGSLPLYGRDKDGQVLPGGTTTLVYDPRTGHRSAEFLSLAGTAVNCAGGVTPWGSWLTCEESVLASPDVPQSHGWVFEVPASAKGLVQPVPIKAMGRFRHEAVAIDPLTGIAYLTEDRDDGLFYRFIPQEKGRLASGGKLQALALANGLVDSRNWSAQNIFTGQSLDVRWVDLDDVESPADDLRLRGHMAGAVVFARGEGIHLGVAAREERSEFFFTCTSGGARRLGQIFRLQAGVDGAPDQLQLFLESTDPDVMDYADNIAVAPWGHMIVCEDRTGGKVNHIRCVTPGGQVYTLARLNADTELAGACFSPDGGTLFFNAYSPGRTLAVTGPWRNLKAA